MVSAIEFAEAMQLDREFIHFSNHFWVLIPLSAALGVGLSRLAFSKSYLWELYAFLVAIAVIFSVDRLYFATDSLQMIWFIIVSLILGFFAFYIAALAQREQRLSITRSTHALIRSAYLTRIWTSRAIRSQYSQNVLGIGWVIINPLAQAIVLALIFSLILNRGEVEGRPFVLFLLAGIVVFGIFSRTVLRSTASLINTMGVIKQIYFPREIILLTILGEVLVTFLVSFLTLEVISLFFGVPPNWLYLYLPIPLLIMFGLALGTALFASFATLVVRDLQQIIALLMQLTFYLTVLFSLRFVSPELRILGLVNPLAVIVEFFRAVMLYGQLPDLSILVWPAILAIVLSYSGYVFFKSNEGQFLDFS